jgi:ribosomal protein L21
LRPIDPRRWLDIPPVLARHGNLIVVRDDLLDGGTKMRFLPFLVRGAEEIVYGSPFCGGAAVALSVIGRETGQKITLFYAKRSKLHTRQRTALRNGATIYQVPTGYMTNVQAKARAYAAQHGALFLPLGFDVPAAVAPLADALRALRKRTGDPAQIWVAAGSGMLARNLGHAFPSSEIKAVGVGLKSKHGAQPFPPNVQVIDAGMPFSEECKQEAPFPCCPNYDRKAWVHAARYARGSAMFWNVLG